MEAVPLYLLVFYFKIRKHACEKGYLLNRLKDADARTAVDEVSMLTDLEKLSFLTRSKRYSPATFELEIVDIDASGSNSGLERHYETITVQVPETFIVLSRGRRYWTEVLSRCALWLATALLGAAIALIIGQK